MTNEELFYSALKSHRESKNIEISEICEFTKINRKYIEAIESGDFDILPIVYMRLFLREYSNFIGVDSVKTLEDFELHTTGAIQKRTDFDIKPTGNAGNLNEVKETIEPANQIAPKQIIAGAAVLVGLFLVLYWAGKITREQYNEVEKTSEPMEEKMPEILPLEKTESVPTNYINPSNNSTEKKSPVIDQLAKSDAKHPEKYVTPLIKEVVSIFPKLEEVKPANLPNKLPLNTNDFLLENRMQETTTIVKLIEPYSITIITLKETKLNISKSHGGILTELVNTVAPAGEIFQFNFESTINFEFWNNNHIKMQLNTISMDNFISDTGFSVRGSYEADKSQLYLGFYRH